MRSELFKCSASRCSNTLKPITAKRFLRTHSESAWTLKSNLKLHLMKKQHTTLYSSSGENEDNKQPGQCHIYHISQHKLYLYFCEAVWLKHLVVLRESSRFYLGCVQGRQRYCMNGSPSPKGFNCLPSAVTGRDRWSIYLISSSYSTRGTFNARVMWKQQLKADKFNLTYWVTK